MYLVVNKKTRKLICKTTSLQIALSIVNDPHNHAIYKETEIPCQYLLIWGWIV